MRLLLSILAVSLGVACSRAPKQEPAATSTPTTAAASGDTKSVFGWNDTVTLSGTLVEKEVLSAKGGSITTTFLKLDRPISVHDKPGEQLGSYDGESELWYAGESPTPRALVGKRVTFKGNLNPMQTGHHHSNVWLTGELTAAR